MHTQSSSHFKLLLNKVPVISVSELQTHHSILNCVTLGLVLHIHVSAQPAPLPDPLLASIKRIIEGAGEAEEEEGPLPSCSCYFLFLPVPFGSASSPGSGGSFPKQQLNKVCRFSNPGESISLCSLLKHQSFKGPLLF